MKKELITRLLPVLLSVLVLAFFPVDNHLAEGFVIEVDDRNPEIGFAGLYLRRSDQG